MAKLLIVDGDERFRESCARDLTGEGHEVLTASTGFDALRLVEEHLPEVVITEIRLPGMDGLDLMGRLLAQHRGLIVILNSWSPSYKQNFMSWAADACLTKTTDNAELRARVREALRARVSETTAPGRGTASRPAALVAGILAGPQRREMVHS